MNKIFNYISLLTLLLVISTGSLKAQTLGEERGGTVGFQFTKIAVDPRSAAMGNSNMADATDGSSLYWNPALSARVDGPTVMISHTSYFAGINQDYFGYIHKINSFSIGGSIQYLNSGEIKETTEFQPFGTARMFSTHHLSVGLSGAHKVTELFSYGITVKFLMEKIEEISYSTGAVDFGFSYLVGETGLRFAVGINNFGTDATPSGTTTREGLNGMEEVEPTKGSPSLTRFHIGAAYDLLETDNSKLVITGQVTNPSDNAEQFNIGAEYTFMSKFFVRSGYEFGHVERKIPSMGVGFALPLGNRVIRADYGYTIYERLGDIHRLAISFTL